MRKPFCGRKQASRLCLLLSAMLVFACLTSCAKPEPSAQDTGVTFTDAQGRTVTVTKHDRVAACLASYGEVWQLAGGTLAGVTHEAWSEREMDLDGVADLGTNDAPSAELLLAGNYDFVLLSGGKKAQSGIAETLEAAGIPCAFFNVETFDEYLEMLEIMTRITGRSDLYEKNGTALEESIRAWKDKANAQSNHPTVLLLRSQSTAVKARRSDNMVGAMLADLGCINIAEQDESLLEALSMEVIVREDPDYIFAVTMGDEDAARKSLDTLITENPAWKDLQAVKNGHFHILQKELYQYKPNARWGEAYEGLYRMLYEE